MKNRNTGARRTAEILRRLVGVIALVLTFGVAMPQTTSADVVAPPPVPENLQVPDGNEAFLVGHAVGTQNYVCSPSPSIGQVAWALFTPQATLFDDGDEQILTHYFSPNPAEGDTVRATWEDSADTSIVWGRGVASSSAPSFVNHGAIPWLLVEVVGTAAGPTGGDALSGTTFIQRVRTELGAAPSSGCRLPTDIGKREFVPYAADYVFYRKSN